MLQENCALHTLRGRNKKMKVNLAVQTLSTSVPDAIDFCREDFKLPQFKHSEGTVNFIGMFDKLFHFLNSRNARGFKAPLLPSNKSTWMDFFEKVKQYNRALTDASGIPIFKAAIKKLIPRISDDH